MTDYKAESEYYRREAQNYKFKTNDLYREIHAFEEEYATQQRNRRIRFGAIALVATLACGAIFGLDGVHERIINKTLAEKTVQNEETVSIAYKDWGDKRKLYVDTLPMGSLDYIVDTSGVRKNPDTLDSNVFRQLESYYYGDRDNYFN